MVSISVELVPILNISTPQLIALFKSLILENPGIEWMDSLVFLNLI